MKPIFKPILLLAFLIAASNTFSQTKIDQSKEELKKGSPKNTGSNNTSPSSTNPPKEKPCRNGFGDLVADVFLYLTYYSIIGSYGSEDHLHSKLTKYPYYNQSSGNFESTDSSTAARNRFRIDIDNQFLFSHKDLFGNHIRAKIHPFQYFHFQLDYIQLKEFNSFSAQYSNLALLDINFCYDRLRFEKFNLGWALGMNYVANGVNKAGFTGGFNTDIFIAHPISLFSSIKWSSVNGLPVNQFEVQAKYHQKKFFVSLGYERLKIATPNYNFLSFGGGIYL